jgi:hypothetical protein
MATAESTRSVIRSAPLSFLCTAERFCSVFDALLPHVSSLVAYVTCDRLLTAQADFVLFKLRQIGAVSEEDITLCRQLFQLLVSDLNSRLV